MISLSHERQCFFAPTMLGMTPTTCIRFAVLSRIEILHILLEHFCDSQRKREQGSVRRLHLGSQSREARSCSVRSSSSSGGSRRRIGCTPRREGSGQPPGGYPAATAMVAR